MTKCISVFSFAEKADLTVKEVFYYANQSSQEKTDKECANDYLEWYEWGKPLPSYIHEWMAHILEGASDGYV